MPDHARKQIRDAIETAVTGLTTTGSNVFQNRVFQIDDSMLPGLFIYTEDDPGERISSTGGVLKVERTPTFSIEAVVIESGADSAEETLDTICNEVQKALEADTAMGGLTKDLRLETTEFNRSGEGEQTAVSAIMKWIAMYHVNEGAPDVIVA